MDSVPDSERRLAGLQQDMAGVPGGLWISTRGTLAGERSSAWPHLLWPVPAPHSAGGLAPAKAPCHLQHLPSGLRDTKVMGRDYQHSEPTRTKHHRHHVMLFPSHCLVGIV